MLSKFQFNRGCRLPRLVGRLMLKKVHYFKPITQKPRCAMKLVKHSFILAISIQRVNRFEVNLQVICLTASTGFKRRFLSTTHTFDWFIRVGMHRFTSLHALFPGQNILQISLFVYVESIDLESDQSGLLRKNQFSTTTNKLTWSIRAQHHCRMYQRFLYIIPFVS